jgi:hypothetical protein
VVCMVALCVSGGAPPMPNAEYIYGI